MGGDGTSTSDSPPTAFSKDVLSIEIEGPSRPQLTLVDIPGLIQTETKGVTKADVDVVAEITDYYIRQSRTICLAVVSATHDYVNQKILTKVREVDPDGERTLGIITKPDRLSAGSGSERAFLELARNNDVFFKLGWHVLKNRTFEEGTMSLIERKISEATFFRKSNFQALSGDCVGIDALRNRLSSLLFEHAKQELPNLRQDLEGALVDATEQLSIMGKNRSTPRDCKTYLMELSVEYHDVCKAAAGGHYEGEYFDIDPDHNFSPTSPQSIRRLRAVVQASNNEFSDLVRTKGHKYHIDLLEESKVNGVDRPKPLPSVDAPKKIAGTDITSPVRMSKEEALQWVSGALVRTRGKELIGNFNPLVVGELFWEQCSHWRGLARNHLERMDRLCSTFLETLLKEMCPRDVHSRLWSSWIQETLKYRTVAALKELDLIMEDIRHYPINYNHYYTDTILARRRKAFSTCIENATTHDHLQRCHSNHTSARIDVSQALDSFFGKPDRDMDRFSCEEALDCVFAIYKVSPHPFKFNNLVDWRVYAGRSESLRSKCYHASC